MSDRRELFFDTGCLLDIYHGRERIRPYFDEVMSGEVRSYLSVITEAELWRGLRVGEIARHEALFHHFTILPLRTDAARLAGRWMQVSRFGLDACVDYCYSPFCTNSLAHP